MTQPDMDVIKEIPGYKLILKSVLKSQIQQLVDQLSAYTDEESVILTANMSDGTLSHLGSDYGKFFLENDDSMKSKFLKFCIKVHQVKEQEKKAEESLRKLATPSPLVLQLSSPSLTGNTQKSPKSRPTKQQHPYPVNMFKASPKPKGQGASRYEPYRKILPKAAEKKSDVPVIPDVKTEPGSTDETGESNGANSGHSPYEEKPQFGLEDDAKSNSSSSTISVDPQDMTVKDAQLGDGYDSSANLNLENISQQLDKNDLKGNLSETDRGTPRIKVEATEEDESELEITSVEPGPSSVPPKNWTPGVQSGIDQSGAATSSMVDLQGYKMTSSSSLKKDEKTLAYAHETKITVQTKESVQHMKSYTCKQCGKTFRYKSQMDKHIRIHTGERPFACDICGFSFKEKGHLRNHMITLHQNGYQ